MLSMNQRAPTMRLLLLLTVMAGSAGRAALSSESYLSYTGTAMARHSTRFLYGEQHELLYRDDRLVERTVLYTCSNGSPFARKIVSYVDPLAPDFSFEDASNGMRAGVRTLADGRSVFFRADRIDQEKVKSLPQMEGLVADSGFDEFIRVHWQELVGGKHLALQFLVPSRLSHMGFEAERLRRDKQDGVEVEVIRLKPAGPLGWVIPGIDVAYGAQDRLLVNYQGVSDLRDAAGDNYQAEIAFRPGDRKAGSAQRMAAARRVALAACR